MFDISIWHNKNKQPDDFGTKYKKFKKEIGYTIQDNLKIITPFVVKTF